MDNIPGSSDTLDIVEDSLVADPREDDYLPIGSMDGDNARDADERDLPPPAPSTFEYCFSSLEPESDDYDGDRESPKAPGPSNLRAVSCDDDAESERIDDEGEGGTGILDRALRQTTTSNSPEPKEESEDNDGWGPEHQSEDGLNSDHEDACSVSMSAERLLAESPTDEIKSEEHDWRNSPDEITAPPMATASTPTAFTTEEMASLRSILAVCPPAGVGPRSAYHTWARARWESWSLVDRIFYMVSSTKP